MGAISTSIPATGSLSASEHTHAAAPKGTVHVCGQPACNGEHFASQGQHSIICVCHNTSTHARLRTFVRKISSGPLQEEHLSSEVEALARVREQNASNLNARDAQGLLCVPALLRHGQLEAGWRYIDMPLVAGRSLFEARGSRVGSLPASDPRDAAKCERVRSILFGLQRLGLRGHDRTPKNFILPYNANTPFEGGVDPTESTRQAFPPPSLLGCPVVILDFATSNSASSWWRNCMRLSQVFLCLDCTGLDGGEKMWEGGAVADLKLSKNQTTALASQLGLRDR